MKHRHHTLLRLFIAVILCLFAAEASAHIKWFVEFEVSDPPQSLLTHPALRFAPNLVVFATWGIILFGVFDYWADKLLQRRYTLAQLLFKHQGDIGLSVARIGTGVFFIVVWLMGNTTLAPELIYTTERWIGPLQLLIAFAVLLNSTVWVAGIGILILYAYSIHLHGLFHLLDYMTLAGLGIYLLLSGLPAIAARYLDVTRYAILYCALVFAFLWSAVEKIAYPQVFHRFLAEYPGLTMGLDQDFFILSAAIVEFALFFLLLFSGNGMMLLALLANLLITVGNIYFGKIDAVGHWPVNFILVIMLLHGPLPIRSFFMNQRMRRKWVSIPQVLGFYLTVVVFTLAYYGLHRVVYGA